ncbi:MAG TPA: hypothetical protein VFV31_08060 [Chitinophagaceae bacterium]|nr:hypothetical protein [Chitinophagaceae bacterium]
MEHLLFAIWLLFLSWLVTKVRFFTQTGLSKPQLISFFLLKVMAGIFYGWIGLYYGGLAKMQDTWNFHFGSLEEYNLLFSDPKEYLTNLFRDPYQSSGVATFFGSDNSYWNDLKGNLFIKILSLFNVLSTGNYYINVIFYSFISLFGPLAIYRVMSDVFPSQKTPVLLATFLVPSFIYWTSGLHKEGLIFTGISLVIYAVYFGTKEKKWGFRRISSLVTGLLLLLALRNFIFVIIVAAVVTWLLANRYPKRGLAIFASSYLVFIVLFFSLRYVDSRLDFPQAVVDKQKAFLELQPGSSTIATSELNATAGSFLRNIPQAVNLSMLRPFPGDVRHILSLAAAFEIDVLLFLFVVFLLWHQRKKANSNLVYFCLFFSLSLLLAIGFTNNNLGAIVRYRSVIIPLLIVPMVAKIDWTKITAVFSNNIKIKNNV